MSPFARPSELDHRVRDSSRREHLLRAQRLCDDLALQPCLSAPGMGGQKFFLVVQAYSQHILLSSGALSEHLNVVRVPGARWPATLTTSWSC